MRILSIYMDIKIFFNLNSKIDAIANNSDIIIISKEVKS